MGFIVKFAHIQTVSVYMTAMFLSCPVSSLLLVPYLFPNNPPLLIASLRQNPYSAYKRQLTILFCSAGLFH